MNSLPAQRLGAFSEWSGGSDKSDLSYIYDMQEKLAAKRSRSGRKDGARRLSRLLTHGYDSSTMDQKITCIWSAGATFSWTEALSGIRWVAVHGVDSICVATRIKDLELEFSLRVAMLQLQPEDLLRAFTNGLIGKVEDFVDPSCGHYQALHPIIKKPFGVVSVAPYTKLTEVSGHEVSSDEYDEENAIKFLQKEMESGMAFNLDETIRTAIRGLDHLFRKNFHANEIMVFAWKKDINGGEAKALPHIREELDISEHLAVINNPDNCVPLTTLQASHASA